MWMTPTRHEKNEWARMSQYATRKHRPDFAKIFGIASRLRDDEQVTLKHFDALQASYRAWLHGEWKPVEGD